MRAIQRQLIFAMFSYMAACSDAAAPIPAAVDHDAEGTWAQDNGGAIVPGNSFSFTMHEAAGTIDGGGRFAGEAGPFGTLEVSGTIANDVVQLRIIYVYEPTVFPTLAPDTAEFTGVMTNRDHIDGKLTRAGSTFPIRFVRSL